MDMTVPLMDVAPNSDKLTVAKSVLNLVHNRGKASGSETRFSNGENVSSSLVDVLRDNDELKPKTNKTNPNTDKFVSQIVMLNLVQNTYVPVMTSCGIDPQ